MAHHALLITSRQEHYAEAISLVEELLAVTAQANPDFHTSLYEVLKVDHVRDTIRIAHQRSVRERMVVMLQFRSATHEAQNALLKVLEEPPQETYVVLVTPFPDVLLPTILSRVERRSVYSKETEPEESFLSMEPAERMRYLAPYIEKKEYAALHGILDAVEEQLAGRYSEQTPMIAKHVLTSRGYLLGRSPSVKQLFEHIALTAPVL